MAPADRCWRHHGRCRIGARYGHSRQIRAGAARFGIVEPVVMQRLTIRIVASAGVQGHRLADFRLHHDRRGSRLAIHFHHGVMIGMREIRNRPIHARRKIVLIRFPPSPDGRLVGCILLAVRSTHGVLRRHAREQIAALRPDGMRLTVRLPVNIAPAPAAPVRPALGVQPVVDQSQERRRVAFHDEHEPRIHLAQRTLAADVGLQPRIGDRRKSAPAPLR